MSDKLMSDEITLADRVRELEAQHGGLRAAARACQCDPGYLVHLRNGTKTNPSPKFLRRLGVKRKVIYVRTK